LAIRISPQPEEVLENHTTPTSFSASPPRWGWSRGDFIGEDATAWASPYQTLTLKSGERSPPVDAGRNPPRLHGLKATETKQIDGGASKNNGELIGSSWSSQNSLTKDGHMWWLKFALL
jgi:hypothetical protein